MKRIALLVTALACGGARPAAEGPPKPVPEPVFATEVDAIAAVSGYFPGPDLEVSLVVSSQVLIPFADLSGMRIATPPFLSGPAAMQRHLGALSPAAFAGRLRAVEEFPSLADAYDAYRVFMIALLAHEIAHLRRGAAELYTDRPFVEETAAIDLEQAVLRKMVAAGAAPASWIDRYRAFNRALLASIPAERVAAIPADAAARGALFDAHYPRVPAALAAAQTGDNPAQESTDLVLATYTIYRLERLDAAPDPDAVLRDLLTPAR